jgi:hypothetical protein
LIEIGLLVVENKILKIFSEFLLFCYHLPLGSPSIEYLYKKVQQVAVDLQLSIKVFGTDGLSFY